MAGRLIDKIFVRVRAGNGGNGALAYTAHKRKKFLGPGFPCGGNGGRGGDIVVIANQAVRSLGSISPTIVAGHGSCGGKERRHGSSGKSVQIQVPPGTLVFDQDSGLQMGDLDANGQSLTAAYGGIGGKGNNSVSPHETTKGQIGESRRILLELKTIADIGLVGFPNAGKSSLLAFLSRASPKVASYPFTTLDPHLGVVDAAQEGKKILVADIPGLVEDAHIDRGMGHEFLRHVVRTKALLFVIDATGAHWNTTKSSFQRPISLEAKVEILRREIELYDTDLARKPWGLVCNKTDLVSADMDQQMEHLERCFKKISGFRGVVGASAQAGTGKEGLLELLSRLMQNEY